MWLFFVAGYFQEAWTIKEDFYYALYNLNLDEN